jgi:osmotically-inducible protein OsmY
MTTATIHDTQVRDDVLAELAFDLRVEPLDIAVLVKDGVVTMTGTVATLAMRHLAEVAAHKVHGVRAVANELAVKLPHSDEDIALAAVQALDRDPYVPQDRLDITVSDARVTLSGEVNWEYQRYAAVVDVMRLIGAKDVINGITVASPLH